jgi:uncharacterized protein (DUF433 family)
VARISGERRERGDRMTDRPAIWVDPGVSFGSPCVMGTGVATEWIADRVWYDDVATTLSEWDHLTTAGVKCACWYQATYGTRKWRRRWAAWAEEHAMRIWRGEWDDVPDPPSRDDGRATTAPTLGWWTIAGSELLDALRRCQAGEDAALVYAEMYANSDHEWPST